MHRDQVSRHRFTGSLDDPRQGVSVRKSKSRFVGDDGVSVFVSDGIATIVCPELEDSMGRGESRIGSFDLSYYIGFPTLLRSTGEIVYRAKDVLNQFETGPEESTDSGTTSSDTGFGLDWERAIEVRADKTEEPGDDQHSLKEFQTATQVAVNPDAVEVDDERIEELPAFVDADSVGALSKYHPGTGDKMECDHCGAQNPWGRPLERGVHSVRPGGIEDGNPEYEHCDPDQTNLKKCDCCGCPRCSSKSLRYRSGSEDFACNHCSLEFTYPINIDGHDDAEREQLLWECKFCGGATRAPFVGVPVDLLD